MDRRAKHGSTLRAKQSMDCANPCFAPNINMYVNMYINKPRWLTDWDVGIYLIVTPQISRSQTALKPGC